jgi:hypothetical protein
LDISNGKEELVFDSFGAKILVYGLMEHCNKAKVHLQFFCEEELVPYYENMGCIAFAVGMRRK